MSSREKGPSQTRGEKWQFVTSDKEYSVDQLYISAVLPCVAVVTQGYYGDIGIDIVGLGQVSGHHQSSVQSELFRVFTSYL
jgi:hypothetical protein